MSSLLSIALFSLGEAEAAEHPAPEPVAEEFRFEVDPTLRPYQLGSAGVVGTYTGAAAVGTGVVGLFFALYDPVRFGDEVLYNSLGLVGTGALAVLVGQAMTQVGNLWLWSELDGGVSYRRGWISLLALGAAAVLAPLSLVFEDAAGLALGAAGTSLGLCIGQYHGLRNTREKRDVSLKLSPLGLTGTF